MKNSAGFVARCHQAFEFPARGSPPCNERQAAPAPAWRSCWSAASPLRAVGALEPLTTCMSTDNGPSTQGPRGRVRGLQRAIARCWSHHTRIIPHRSLTCGTPLTPKGALVHGCCQHSCEGSGVEKILCFSISLVEIYTLHIAKLSFEEKSSAWRDGSGRQTRMRSFFLDTAQRDSVEAQASSGKAPYEGPDAELSPTTPASTTVTANLGHFIVYRFR
jgi:hypothetical protein